MSEFKLDRFKYIWKGEWQSATAYKRDDVVGYNGKSFVCISAHTSNVDFYADLQNQDEVNSVPAPRWIKMTDSQVWRGDWEAATNYNPGDVVAVNGVLYIAIANHTSPSEFDPDDGNWFVFLDQTTYRDDWVAETEYFIGDVVSYNGIVYKCIETHTARTADTGLEADLDKWSVYYSNIQYRGNYAESTRYRLNDLVRYKASLLRCIEGYTSDSLFDETKWQIELEASKYEVEWNPEEFYSIGNVVKFGGYLYYAIRNGVGQLPSESLYGTSDSTPYWEVIYEGINFVGDWNVNQDYKTGDVVRRGGNLYLALLDTTLTGDDSSLGYLDDSNWKLLTVGQKWNGPWASNVSYGANDLVSYIGSTYKALIGHISSTANAPDDETLGDTFWQLVAKGDDFTGLKDSGDLLTRGFPEGKLGDFDAIKNISIPVGEDGQVLIVTEQEDIEFPADLVEGREQDTIPESRTFEYVSWGQNQRIKYVSPDGVDDITDPVRGTTPFTPYKTIRFAAETADDGFTGQTTISVAPGVYDELLPITIPKNTALVGSELRSTTVRPAAANSALLSDVPLKLVGLNRISEIIENVILGNPISATEGNTVSQSLTANKITLVSFSPPVIDLFGNETFNVITTPVVGSQAAAQTTKSLVDTLSQYIDFNINGNGTNPTVTGSNTATTDTGFEYARLILEANREFLVQEVLTFLSVTNPNTSIDAERFRSNINEYITAWLADLEFLGTYKTIFAGRYYANEILGSDNDDMFYVRDGAGIRNLTVIGLEGEIADAPVEDVPFRAVTGPAYVSLDPGWGPAHEDCWIINRSPYIQNVTTFGTACIGQKIDGALHNGGNKSIVSNDFTQVLSDGIGAWVTNNGRAELVSVFTYYCNIGYYTSNGGIIRSTNGNNSYGNFGSLALGRDPTEIPRSGTLDNRTTEATVASPLIASLTGVFQVLQYDNCGQDYRSASATIVGPGAQASTIFEDFRDDAVFEVRARDTSDDEVAQEIGGSGYIVQQNNAQLHSTPGGDATSITIAATDDQVEASYLGMRIIIVGGAGTGQYGYITAYNTTSKVISVSRESDDQPGWDHVVPGTPSVEFEANTVYRIEPRVEFNHPGFEAAEISIGSTDNWVSAVYGETTEVFNDVTGEPGTGEVVTDDGLSALTASFDITKRGRTYEVALKSESIGDEDNDQVINGDFSSGITGWNLLGDAGPENSFEVINSAATIEGTDTTISQVLTLVPSARYIVSTSIVSLDVNTLVTLSVINNVGATVESVTSTNTGLISVEFIAPVADMQVRINVTDSTGGGGSKTATVDNVKVLPALITLSGGAGYAVGDEITILGTALNGLTPQNDLTITVTEVSDDSTNSITDFTFEGEGGSGVFLALAGVGSDAGKYSYDGENWDNVTLPAAGPWGAVAAGDNRFVAINTEGSGTSAIYSLDGITWTESTLPAANDWVSIVYGEGKFVALSQTNNNVAISTNGGVSWTLETIAGDARAWNDITYGKGRFVAVSQSLNFSAYSEDGITWVQNEIGEEVSVYTWNSVAYGNNRFVTVSATGNYAFSFDGITWTFGSIPQYQSANVDWKQIRYGQGVFLAVGTDSVGAAIPVCVSSEDGIVWTYRDLNSSLPWTDVAFGNPYIQLDDSTVGKNTPIWIAVGSGTNVYNKIRTGKRAFARAESVGGRVARLLMIDPGSGYRGTTTVTLTSPVASAEPDFRIRLADGVLAQPSWINRGIGYTLTNTTITITGDGFADVYPLGRFIIVRGLSSLPSIGAQVAFAGDDSKFFTIVTVSEVTDEDIGTVSARLRLTPELRVRDEYDHGIALTIRENVSQVRLTNHDFLDIGTGNFTQTNYPEIYTTGLFTNAPENEVQSVDGGVVFYTSTDQIGNFRVGELFQVEQATGIVTLSADFFDLDGLSELRLGGIRVGGSGAVIREFSTDPLFVQDSNNVVPTQKAIAAYLQSRLTVGGSEIATASFIAGTVLVGPRTIRNVANLDIVVQDQAIFTPESNVEGTMLIQTLFFASFREQPIL